GQCGEVDAGAETRSVRLEEHRSYLWVGRRRLRGLAELGEHRDVQGVSLLRTGQRDGAQPVVRLVSDGFEIGHRRPPGEDVARRYTIEPVHYPWGRGARCAPGPPTTRKRGNDRGAEA